MALIRPKDKRPGYRDWPLCSKEPDDFFPGDNIGILTGTLSDYLVCVDLDHPRAVELADQYLPTTGMIEGRPGKPRSHRYYRVTNIPPELTASGGISGSLLGGPASKSFRLDKQTTVVEILGTGRHATAPPSLHLSGERRDWDSFGEPAEIECRELYMAVERLAQACGCLTKVLSKSPQRVQSGKQCAPCYFSDLPSMEERFRRAELYLEHMPPAVSGEGGHNQTFRVACTLVRDFALDLDEARVLLEAYNDRCDPPWSSEELEHKLEDANRFSGQRGSKLIELPELPTDPDRLARAFLKRYPSDHDAPTWRFWHGEFWQWHDNRYLRVPQSDLRARLSLAIRDELVCHQRREAQRIRNEKERQGQAAQKGALPNVIPVTTGLVTNTIGALESQTLIQSGVELGSWLTDNGEGQARSYLALSNGLLDVDAYLAGETKLHSHHPRWFSTVVLDYPWEPTTACPEWLKALDLTFESDAERIQLLQEWFGYCLLPWTDLQAFLILFGEGNNGKSVILGCLEAMLGLDNVSHVPLEKFADRFSLTQTLGKLANIVSEMPELDKAAEGTLKTFVSGERMTFDRKHLDPIEAIPTARLAFATNNLPRFSDRSNGVWRRLVLQVCNATIPAGKRVLGMDKAAWWTRSGELPGILAWALEGLKRLRQTNRFTQPATCRTAIGHYQTDCNPARKFLLDYYEYCPGKRTSCSEVYARYRNWCESNGYCALASGPFGKEVFRSFS